MAVTAVFTAGSALEELTTDTATPIAASLDAFNTEFGTALQADTLVRICFTSASYSTGDVLVLVSDVNATHPLSSSVMAFDSAAPNPAVMQAVWPSPEGFIRASQLPDLRVTNTSADSANVGWRLFTAG